MNRRHFLFFLFAFGHGAWAHMQRPLQIPWQKNPGLPALYLRRFREFHRRKFFPDRWPNALETYWHEILSEPRDLCESAGPHMLWPRVSWMHEFSAKDHNPSWVGFFDPQNPQHLRKIFQRAFARKGPRDPWQGFHWNRRDHRFEFHCVEPESVMTVDEGGHLLYQWHALSPSKFSLELNGQILWQGHTPEILEFDRRDSDLAQVQLTLRHEFQELPRFVLQTPDGKSTRLIYP